MSQDRPHEEHELSIVRGMSEHIRTLQSEGVVTDEAADRLLAKLNELSSGRAGEPPRRSLFNPAAALLLIGGILAISAIILILGNIWENMTPWGRFAVVAAPMVLLYLTGAFLRRTQLVSPWFSDGLFFIGGSLAPFAVYLAFAMVRRIPSLADEPTVWHVTAVATGLVVQVATAMFVKGPSLTLPPSLSAFWLTFLWPTAFFGERIGERVIPWMLMLTGAALIAAAQVLYSRGLVRHAPLPSYVGAVALPLGSIILAAQVRGGAFIVSILIPLVMVLAGSLHRLRVLLWPAAVFLVVSIFHAGFEYFRKSVGLPLTLLGCGFLSLIAGYAVQRVQRSRS